MKFCANCGAPIEDDESYFSFLDNYLQVKFFDSEENNIFCSEECAADALSLTEIMPGEYDRKEAAKCQEINIENAARTQSRRR